MMKHMADLEENVAVMSKKPLTMPAEKEEMLNAAINCVDALEHALEETKKKKVLAAKKRDNDSSMHPLSIDDDPLSQAGIKSNGLPGVGVHVSVNQYNASLPSHTMHLDEVSEKKALERRCDRLEAKLDNITDLFTMYISQTGGSQGPGPFVGSSLLVPLATKQAFATISFIAETFIFLYVGIDALDIDKWKSSEARYKCYNGS